MDQSDSENYPYETHLEGIVAEGIEYMVLLYANHSGVALTSQSSMPFLRRMIRTLRSISDKMEIRVSFIEEKLEMGYTDTEAEEAFDEHFREDSDDE